VKSFAASGHYGFGGSPNLPGDLLIPLLVPGVNTHHVDLIDAQRRGRWMGAIVITPSWSTVLLAVALEALRELEVKRVMVTILAGRFPDGANQEAEAEAEAEEERVEREVQNVLGQMEGEAVQPSSVSASVHAAYGEISARHTELVSVEFARRLPMEQIAERFQDFSGACPLRLPSAPRKAIVFHGESDCPDPNSDATSERTVKVHVKRVRRCAVLDYKFGIDGSNRVLGSAAASILNAELVVARLLHLLDPSDERSCVFEHERE
jgi:aspartate-semialdehyde dehydrogenase